MKALLRVDSCMCQLQPRLMASSSHQCHERLGCVFCCVCWAPPASLLQAQQIATFADDMTELRQCKADLGQQLSELQQQHEVLHTQHTTATQQLAQSRKEMQDMCT